MSDELLRSAPAAAPETNKAEMGLFPFKIPDVVKKLIIIGGALLIFQIPLLLIYDLVEDRQENYSKVVYEIGNAWGKEDVRIDVPLLDKKWPIDCRVTADITPEVRYRGIYQTVVYTAAVKMAMVYDLEKNSKRELCLQESAAQNVQILLDGKKIPFKKTTLGYEFVIPSTVQGKVKCDVSFDVRGSRKIAFTDYGLLSVKGAWGDPGFSGTILPEKRTINKDSFEAQWNFANSDNSSVYIDFHLPVSEYASVLRLMRYATFFLLIFFVAFIAAEYLSKEFIHSIQYLVGALTPVLFYMLLLAFAEKVGFLASYIISTAIVVGLSVFYVRMIFARFKPALILGSVFTVAYALNYFILRMEDMALLTGTIVLTAMLAFVMYLTGRLNRRS